MTDVDTVGLKPCPFCGLELVRPYPAHPEVYKHPVATDCFAGQAIVHPEHYDLWNTRTIAALPPAVPDVSKWQNIDGMIYNLVDDETRWENGKRPQMNQYMIRFERQNKAGGSDEELKALQTFIHRALTATPDPVAEAAKVLLANMPNPVFDDLKPVLMGEFGVTVEGCDEDGEECHYIEPIGWSTIKDILSMAILALTKDGEAGKPLRCAECDCENGRTDCNWIATPKETDHER